MYFFAASEIMLSRIQYLINLSVNLLFPLMPFPLLDRSIDNCKLFVFSEDGHNGSDYQNNYSACPFLYTMNSVRETYRYIISCNTWLNKML